MPRPLGRSGNRTVLRNRTAPIPRARTAFRVDLERFREDPGFVQRRTLGSTTASRIKCLYLAVREARGREEADAFLARGSMDRELIEDESRQVPWNLWYLALHHFTELMGPGALSLVRRAVTHRECLGVWTTVLRGAEQPADAYEQLSLLGGEPGCSDPWTTEHASPGIWRGHAPNPPGTCPTGEGLVNRAREAELAAIPTLFGYPPAVVRRLESKTPGVVRFEVRWRRPLRHLPSAAAALGFVVVIVAHLLLPTEWATSGLSLLGCGLLGSAVLGVLGWLVRHDAVRRAQARAQFLRILALERAAVLRDARDPGHAALERGAVIAGQFRLGEQVGSGASGAIWEAERLADGAVVAIKLLRTAVAHDSQAADRLRREADALGLAWHPNVVEVLDEGRLTSGISFLVLERLQGETLASRLSHRGRLSTGEVLRLALECCDALEAVHAAGIVHRDIKPSNLFLARGPEESERLKIIDFGIAQVAWAETRLTRNGTPLGTPGYVPPEQEAGRQVDARSDLFALGAVLYECLSGRPPPISVETNVASRPALEHLDEIEERWREVITKLMAPWPQQRFPSARALRNALVELAPAAGESRKEIA